jgi:hypothetical protein
MIDGNLSIKANYIPLLISPTSKFQQYFCYIMATSISGGKRLSTQRKPPTMGKQLVNFITCGCELSAPFLQFTKPGPNPRRIGDRLV